MTTHCMVDIETLGTRPGSAVIAIGAYVFCRQIFDMTSPVVPGHELIEPRGEMPGFYIEIDAFSCATAGMKIDPQTLVWWERQGYPAKGLIDRVEKRLYEGETGHSLGGALEAFAKWLTSFPAVALWGNGSDFDNVLLGEAYRAIGQAPPWDHRASRCFRTLRALAPHVPEVPSIHPHVAWCDAQAQAVWAQNIFKEIGYQG